MEWLPLRDHADDAGGNLTDPESLVRIGPLRA